MKSSKKLKWSSIPIDDLLIEHAFKRHEKETGLQSEYISKRALVAHILSEYIKGDK